MIPATILTGARTLQQVVEELGMDIMEVKWAKSRLEHETDEKVEGKLHRQVRRARPEEAMLSKAL